MGNEQNLKPFSKDSVEKARECGRKGGKKSGETKRKRKQMREQMELLLSLPITQQQIIDKFRQMGINSDNMDNQMALQVAMMQSAMAGNVNAYNSIRELVGERVVEVNVSQNIDSKVNELEEYINARTKRK